MKRSNRLILLIGILLAAVAGVGAFFLLSGQGGEGRPSATPAVTTVVEAAVDIASGTKILEGMVTAREYPLDKAPTGGYTQTSQVIGETVRTEVTKGQMITASIFTANAGTITEITPLIKSGQRAMAIRVDQTTGVGTLIMPGDHVDLVVAYTQQYEFAADNTINYPPDVSQKTVKVVLQNLEVLGTLLPEPEEAAEEPGATPVPGQPAGAPTTLTDRQQIVIVAVDPQQAEVIKFVQASESETAITLILRSADDYVAEPVDTTGIILSRMIDDYGVLPLSISTEMLAASPRPTPRR